MKIVYKKSVLDRIRDEIKQADSRGREIEKIILTAQEYRSVQVEVIPAPPMPVRSASTLLGIPFEVE